MPTSAAAQEAPSTSNAILHVITPISNPRRFKSRYRLFEDFAEYMKQFANVQLHPIEMAFGDRPHAINHPNLIKVRGNDELWHKENLINIAAKQLPLDWKYMAWIDADVQFARPDWSSEAIHLLQHYSVIQLFSTADDLGPTYEPFMRHKGFVAEIEKAGGLHRTSRTAETMPNAHPGYAWAIRRDAFEGVGGLIDTTIAGSGDRHMALAMYGFAEFFPLKPHGVEVPEAYTKPILEWQERAKTAINYNVGYLPGHLLHAWHGSKQDRQYKSRWSIITDNNFDPAKDLIKDSQGLWSLTPSSVALREDFRHFISSRNEDSIDMPAKAL